MKIETKLPTYLIVLLILSSCGSRTKYKPSIYGHDYIHQEIIKPVTHERISCGSPDFNEYASVHLDDLTKLALVLKYAKVPYKVRLLIENFRKEVRLRKKQSLESLKNSQP